MSKEEPRLETVEACSLCGLPVRGVAYIDGKPYCHAGVGTTCYLEAMRAEPPFEKAECYVIDAEPDLDAARAHLDQRKSVYEELAKHDGSRNTSGVVPRPDGWRDGYTVGDKRAEDVRPPVQAGITDPAIQAEDDSASTTEPKLDAARAHLYEELAKHDTGQEAGLPEREPCEGCEESGCRQCCYPMPESPISDRLASWLLVLFLLAAVLMLSAMTVSVLQDVFTLRPVGGVRQ